MIADNPFPKVGVVFEPTAKLGDELGVGRGTLACRGERSVLDFFGGLDRRRVERGRTGRAESLVASQRRPTLFTLLKRGRALLAGVADVVDVEDRVVHLLVGDEAVRRHLPCIFVPVSAVLDLLVAQPLSNPLRDSGPAEQVRVDAAGVEASRFSNLRDASAGILLAERPIVIAVEPPRLVDECNIRVLRTWVDVYPVGEVAPTPGERFLTVRIFDVCVGVDADGCSAVREVDIADPQREDRAETEASIPQEGNECLVPGGSIELSTGVEHRREFLVGNLVFGVVLALDGCADGNLVGKLGFAPHEELLERLLVVADSPFGESVFVAEIQLEGVHVVDGFELDERHLRPLGGESDTIQVSDDSPQRLDVGVVGSEMRQPACDLSPVAVVEVVALFEEVALVLELGPVALHVVNVGHMSPIERMDYSSFHGNPGGTTKKFYIIQTPERCLSPASDPGIVRPDAGATVETEVSA